MNKVVLLFCLISLAFAAENIRLVDQDGYVSDLVGRVEVLRDGKWGQICADGFDASDSQVVCRSLDYDKTGEVVSGQHGLSALPIFFTNVACNGEETTIFDCSKRVFDDTSICSAGNVAAVNCAGPVRTSGTLGLEGGVIAGIVICLVAIVAMVLLFGACLWRNDVCCAPNSA